MYKEKVKDEMKKVPIPGVSRAVTARAPKIRKLGHQKNPSGNDYVPPFSISPKILAAKNKA